VERKCSEKTDRAGCQTTHWKWKNIFLKQEKSISSCHFISFTLHLWMINKKIWMCSVLVQFNQQVKANFYPNHT
jgi:hypothetical protein